MGACGSVREQIGNDNDPSSHQKYADNRIVYESEKSEVSLARN